MQFRKVEMPCGMQPLTIDRHTATLRLSEPGPQEVVDFFLRVGKEAQKTAHNWNLRVLQPLPTHNRTVEDCARVILDRLGGEATPAPIPTLPTPGQPKGPASQGEWLPLSSAC